MKKILLGLLLATLASTGWGQAKFSYFGPVNGILKGSTTTWETTQAADTDVLILWSGTCSNTTYLRGDGICSTPPGTGGGTVNSVSQTVPAGFAIGGSPVTNTGTLAITYATGQTNHLVLGTGTAGQLGLIALTTADIPTIPLGSGVSGLLPVANGGTGIGTLTGLLKGNGTSAFSVAASADVIGLWTGTCSSATFLRGDGSCAAPAASGTVTSVGLSWTGSGLTIGGTPVTTSGTLAISGLLGVPAGGIGVGTLTGLVKGNGTSAFSAAAAADVYSLWSGTCSSATFLRGDGSCAAPGGATGANPTATVGPTANNGSSTNFMRADASPAFCLTCAFTQTGAWTFSPTAGVGVDINGVAGSYAAQVIGAVTTGQSFGLRIAAGTTGSDVALGIANQAASVNLAVVFGNGAFIHGFNGSTSTITGTSAGNVTIAAPSSGIAETINGAAGTNTLQIISGESATAQSAEIQVNRAGSTINQVGEGPGIQFFDTTNTTSTQLQMSGGQTELWQFNGAWNQIWAITSSRGMVINAPASGSGLQVAGVSNAYAETIFGSNTSGQSFGLKIDAGTTSSDLSLLIQNRTATTNYLQVFGDGGSVFGSPTGSDKGLGSINAQSIFVNNSAVCLASGTNCPGAASLHYAAATFSLSGSSCSVINGVGISTCTWAATGNATVFFTSGLFTSASTVNCVGTASGGSTTQFTNNTPSGSGGSVNTNVFTFNGAGIAVNGGFTLICLGT